MGKTRELTERDRFWLEHEAILAKSKTGIKTPKEETDVIRERLRRLKEMLEMTTKNDELELVHGSGNVLRDLGLADADKEHLRAQWAAEIIGIVRRRKLTQREAAKLTALTLPRFRNSRTRSWQASPLTAWSRCWASSTAR